MKINQSFVRFGRKFISVALCLVMMFTTFFIFEPSVLSELLPKASAWNFTSYATSTSGNKAGLTINTSAKTAVVNTSDGFAYFLNSINNNSNAGNGEFQGYTVTLNCDVFLQKSQTDLESITYSDNFYDEGVTAWYGVLDGNGHCISNFRYHYDAKRNFTIGCFGLIRKMSGGEIKNLTVLNPHVYTYNQRSKVAYGGGALIGKISSDSNSMFSTVNISNVTVSGAELNNGSKDGASSAREVGGLVGYIEKNTTFSNCKVENSKIQYNNLGVRDGGFVGKSTAEVIIQNDTPAVSVDASTVIYKDGSGDSDHGGLIGWTSGKTTIKNVIMNATVYSGESGGGLIGYIENAEANISDCTFNGKAVATNYAGGLIGNSGSNTIFNISNCKNTGSVSGKQMVGGIIGKATGNTLTVTNCSNESAVTSSNDFIGGIVGDIEGINSSKFENCTNNGTITGATWYIGGIVGRSNNDNNITFNNCKNTVNITSASNRYIGGIIGYAKGKTIMNNCVNTGNISGAQYTAGLCAWIQDDGCEFTNCLNTGTINGNGNSNVGGILSTVDSQSDALPTWTFKNTVNTGTIYGAAATGGILGYMGNLEKAGKVVMTDCINKGDVISTGNDAGGLVGNIYNHGAETTHRHIYTNCYNYGNVSSSSTGDTFIGGIVGKEYGFCDFINCYNYGKISETASSGNNIAGGIAGWIQDDASTVKGCINYGEISGRNNVGGIVGEYSSGSTLAISQCGNYGTLVAKNAGNTYIGGIIGKFAGNTIYVSKCFNGNGTDGQVAASGSKGQYSGGLIGYGNTIYIADSYNNAPAVYGSSSGGLVGYGNGNVNIYNCYNKTTTGVTTSYSGYIGNKDPSSSAGCCSSSSISTGTASISTLNTTRSVVSPIGSAGNAYVYKQGINNNYPVLSWQVNTLSMNLGRNLIADLVSSSGSGFTGNNSTYDVKVDGVTKTYHMAYTKTVNGVSVTYYTFSDTFVLDGTPSATGTFDILNVKNTEGQKTVNLSAYYVGGNVVNSSVSVYSNTISRTGVHKTTSVSASEAVKVSMTVDSSVEDFDNYSFHASMDYSTNVSISSTAEALIDLHSKYAGLATPTKTGYNFLGWYNQRTGGSQVSNGTAVNSGNPSINDTLDRDYDIYARWNPITYTVAYDGNGETSGTTESSTHTYDEAKNLTANGFKREFTVTFDYNYEGSTATTETAKSEFVNWLCSKDGITYDDCASVLNLTTTDKETITMTAQWTDKTVEFPTPTREGYDFLGWFNDDEQEVDESTVISENMTLHAKWQIKTYRVIFMNGDTVCQSSVWEYNTTPQYTSATPTKDSDDDYEYTFSGWSPEIVLVTGDTTYEAQFTEKAHEYECKQLDSEYHQFVCKNCRYEKANEKHTFEYIKSGTGHIYKCKDCGYSYSEDVAEYTVEFTGDLGEVISKTIRSELSTDYYIVTIQAPLKNGDKYFVYWIDSATGEKVSTYRTYSFFQTGDRSFEPVYAELAKYTEERNSAVFSSTVTGVRSRQNNSWSLYAEHSVAKTIDGFPKYNASNKAESIKNIISRYGVIYTTAPQYLTSDITVENMRSVLVMGGGKDVTDKAAGMTDLTRDLTGVLEVNVETDSDAIWARTYVVDANGNVHYGIPKKITLSADTASVESETVTTSSISLDTTDLNIETDAPNSGSETTETDTAEMSFYDMLVSFLKAVWRWILESSIRYF